jgi:hypothetical protein
MRVVFRELNNKGLLNSRPWRVETAAGGYVTSFETEWAAHDFVSGAMRRAA